MISYLPKVFNYLPQLRTIATPAGMALALWISEQLLKTLNQLNFLALFGELKC
jgi:methylase of polypeptide subunit release factors